MRNRRCAPFGGQCPPYATRAESRWFPFEMRNRRKSRNFRTTCWYETTCADEKRPFSGARGRYAGDDRHHLTRLMTMPYGERARPKSGGPVGLGRGTMGFSTGRESGGRGATACPRRFWGDLQSGRNGPWLPMGRETEEPLGTARNPGIVFIWAPKSLQQFRTSRQQTT